MIVAKGSCKNKIIRCIERQRDGRVVISIKFSMGLLPIEMLAVLGRAMA